MTVSAYCGVTFLRRLYKAERASAVGRSEEETESEVPIHI
jgi:hypothetical protein